MKKETKLRYLKGKRHITFYLNISNKKRIYIPIDKGHLLWQLKNSVFKEDIKEILLSKNFSTNEDTLFIG